MNVNTANFLLALEGFSPQIDVKYYLITLWTLVKMGHFSPSMFEIWMQSLFFFPNYICMNVQNWILYYFLFGSNQTLYFVNVWNQSMTKPKHCVAEFHLMWKSNWMHKSNQRTSLIGKLLTGPCPQYFSTHDCWILKQVIEMHVHGSPGGISFAEVNHFFPSTSVQQTE